MQPIRSLPGGLLAFAVERSTEPGVVNSMELSTVHTFDAWSDTERERSRAPDAPALRPTTRYEIISELGGGAMSIVRLAHDTVTGCVVAVKSLSPAAAALPGAQRRFAREAAIAARLRHPNIVRTVAVEREGGTPVAIVTEYVRGRSLRDVLAEGPLPIERAVRILRDVGAALAYAHAQHVVHCDVKPANILLDDEHDRAVLIDFGIACDSGTRPAVEDEELTVGTPVYMAPEQIEGRAVDARTDVYALCIVAWELLAGRMPWLGAPLADVLHRQRHEPLPDLALVRPEIPVYLLNAINGGLAKDPARRWRDAAELLRHLSPRALSVASTRTGDAALDATMRIAVAPAPAPDAPPEPEPYATVPPPRTRTRLVVSTIAAAALLALASLAPRLSHATEHPPAAVDPELDSMLTLAVHPANAAASMASVSRSGVHATRHRARRVRRSRASRHRPAH
jgi:serine/threonine-protein kinase